MIRALVAVALVALTGAVLVAAGAYLVAGVGVALLVAGGELLAGAGVALLVDTDPKGGTP